MNPQSQYVLSGLRPTGRVHRGNDFGAVRNRVQLQDRDPCDFVEALAPMRAAETLALGREARKIDYPELRA